MINFFFVAGPEGGRTLEKSSESKRLEGDGVRRQETSDVHGVRHDGCRFELVSSEGATTVVALHLPGGGSAKTARGSGGSLTERLPH